MLKAAAKAVIVSLIISYSASPIFAALQSPDASQAEPKPADAEPERWNAYYQATSIGSSHGSFRSPYSGPFSLRGTPEKEVSFTTTLFLAFKLTNNTLLVLNPEMAGGRGFSGVNGLANQYNGELPRIDTATPKLYPARMFITQDFGFGDEREDTSSQPNQLAGSRPMNRYSVTVGRFSVTDFFDNNRYTHDPRTQFMGWSVMYNGAWDYPADTRGYTWGWVHELHMKNWSLRYGSAAEPRVANGLRFDRMLFRDRGDMVEGEVRYSIHRHPGAARLLGSLLHTRSGNYAEAIRLADQTGTTPDVTATRRIGTLKYGVGLSADQEITNDVGAFLRLGWNDGKTESFAFTAIDRLVSSGVSVKGTKWKRPNDVAATELAVAGISGVHADYLARGGNDFLIGDGRLRYGHEISSESYYNAELFHGFFVGYDVQHVTNPAYNRDRGPVWIHSLRLHLELGKEILHLSGK